MLHCTLLTNVSLPRVQGCADVETIYRICSVQPKLEQAPRASGARAFAKKRDKYFATILSSKTAHITNYTIFVKFQMIFKFSKHRPFGPMLSISRFVRLCVCPCVCSLFEVPFNGLFAPTSRSRMSNIFRDSESLGKSNGKKWCHI